MIKEHTKIGLAITAICYLLAAICLLFPRDNIIVVFLFLALFLGGGVGLYIAAGVESDGNLFGMR